MKLDIQDNEGLYADPDIIKVGETYYIYPTTDGYTGWSGTEFYVFRSEDRKNWKNCGRILDLVTDVAWSVGSAWAPCMLVQNDTYYFIFCGKRADGISCIGVAKANHPEGPFVAEEQPLITPELVRGCGCSIGQAIDPSIYREGEKTYLLFGNGNGVICELDVENLAIKTETMKNIQGMTDFRESVIVLKKDDKYHFTWSCDDTGSENYHVNYGISDSVYGPVQYLYPVLEKVEEMDILGTGHHSILEDNGEYTIAYHRFGTPLNRFSEGKGFNRELCIDRLEFDNDGLMKPVKVTK